MRHRELGQRDRKGVAHEQSDLRGLSDQLSDLTLKLRDDPSRLVYRVRHDPVVAEP